MDKIDVCHYCGKIACACQANSFLAAPKPKQNIIYKVCWRVLTSAGDNRNMEQLFSSKTRAESFIDEINHAAKLLGVTTLNLIDRDNIGEIILRDSE